VDRMRGSVQWRWHLNEVFVKINGDTHYLWRAVDHGARSWKALYPGPVNANLP
jgi:putative transposase